MLYHGLTALGLPVICIESRQAYQALKSLATHKTDRNDARGQGWPACCLTELLTADTPQLITDRRRWSLP